MPTPQVLHPHFPLQPLPPQQVLQSQLAISLDMRSDFVNLCLVYRKKTIGLSVDV